MPPDVQPSIEAMGLKPYLDQTKHLHKGYGHAEITGWFDEGISTSEVARRIGTSRMTAGKYRGIHRREKQKHDGK